MNQFNQWEVAMRIGTVAAIAVALLWATPAFAAHCPKDVKLIDQTLAKGTSLDAAQMTTVKTLRDSGDQLHKAGKHGESIKALHEALEILGVEH
jgi:hypothetical protein